MNRLRSKAAVLLLIAVPAFFVVSCDGFGWTGPHPIYESPSGLYQGAFTSTATQPSPSRETTGIISEELDAQFLLSSQHYAGSVVVVDTSLTGELTEYRGKRGVFLGFDGISTITLDGDVSERDGIFGTYVGDDDQGRFAFSYESLYEDGSSLDLLSGIWSFNQASAGGGIYTITIDLDADGQLFGSDTAGCVFSGRMGIIDDRYSSYRVAVSVSSCGEVDGDYSGLAFNAPVASGSRLYIGADNGFFAFANLFDRL